MSTYLILGGTGKTGRRITSQLVAAGHTARAASRHPDSVVAVPGVEAVRFDWDDRTTWGSALAGAEGVYVVPPELRLDYAPLVADLAAEAKAAGVRRAVFLSARGGNLDPASPLAQAEAHLAAGGLEWAAIRPSWFAQNLTENFLRPGIDERDALVFPAGEGAEPWIDVEDIAAVAVALLTGTAQLGQGYDLSGPKALTFAETASLVSEAIGREISYVNIDPEEWRAGLLAAGLPEDYVGLLAILAGVIRDGHDARLSDGVQQVLGREPSSFAEWAAREAGQLAAAPVA